MSSGPLVGLRVVEFTGLGPAPLAGQLLADLGAEVTVIDRRSARVDPADINRRGKRSIAVNLKSDAGLEIAKRIIARSDILIEGFRPGVMEKLGLGPEACPDTLIYGRMTGWGQTGPLAQTAGHDLNYLALTGALHMMGEAGRPPPPPLNLVADFGGGTMFLLLGVLAALFERGRSGKGQVVDAAMVDGVPAMMGLLHGMMAQGIWTENRGQNLLDGGAPFYRCYETADGKYLSVGPLEPQFFAELVKHAGLPETDQTARMAVASWPEINARYETVFKQKTRDEWMAIFDGTDACVAPVLTFEEAQQHPHNVNRSTFFKTGAVAQAQPAPRFSRSQPAQPEPPAPVGGDTEQILATLGVEADMIQALRRDGVLT